MLSRHPFVWGRYIAVLENVFLSASGSWCYSCETRILMKICNNGWTYTLLHSTSLMKWLCSDILFLIGWLWYILDAMLDITSFKMNYELCYECNGTMYILTRDILWEHQCGVDFPWLVDSTPVATRNSEMLFEFRFGGVIGWGTLMALSKTKYIPYQHPFSCNPEYQTQTFQECKFWNEVELELYMVLHQTDAAAKRRTLLLKVTLSEPFAPWERGLHSRGIRYHNIHTSCMLKFWPNLWPCLRCKTLRLFQP